MKRKMKRKINKNYNDNKNKIDEWIILKSWNKKNKFNNNRFEYEINYEIKKKIKKRIIVNLYEIMPYAHSTNLTLSPIFHSKGIIEKEKFENYFHQENEGLFIDKDDKHFRIFTNGQEFIEFHLYDYDNMSKTLAVYKEERNRKKIGIYFNKENKHNKTQYLKIIKDLDINSLFLLNSKVNKIKLIPCVNGYENQSILLFIDSEIQIRKIRSDAGVGKTLELKNYFDYKSFDEFQFIVYLDFLLILKYDEKNEQWEGKVFSLYIEDMSIFEEIENTNIVIKGINKEAKFSFAEIKEKKFLFAINNSKDNQYSIIYWEISSQISGISTNYKVLNINDNKTENEFELSNCIINYFYHCFEKYPLLGAMQFNFKKYENKKRINLCFFLDNYNTDNISDFKAYINELKKICQKKKKFLLMI